MTTLDTESHAAAMAATARAPATAGRLLRTAREAAGMSLDTVAQQLKLAPRQVIALEEDDFARLPGRTFVRGFVRNYARLVRLDPESVLAVLTGGDASSLDSPALQATAPTMGELPTAEHAKPGWTRWAIPLTLVAVIATAAFYEFSRDHGEPPRSGPAAEPARGIPPKDASTGGNDTPLPNPASPQAAVGTATAPDAPAPAAAPPAAGSGAGVALPPVAAPTPTATSPAAAPVAAGDVPLVIVYRDTSWTEIKDGAGRVLVSQMIAGGQTRTVAGTPPFDLVIGNAREASVTFRGQPVDLVPHIRQNVARMVLK